MVPRPHLLLTMLFSPSLPTDELAILPRSLLYNPPQLGNVPLPPSSSSSSPPPLPPALRTALRHFLATGETTGPLSAAAAPSTPSPPSAPSATAASAPDIHALGANVPGLLDPFLPDAETAERLRREHASVRAQQGGSVVLGGSARGGAVQPSLLQNQFQLASVFNPESPQDAALFMLGDDAHDEDNDEDGDEDGEDDEGGEEEEDVGGGGHDDSVTNIARPAPDELDAELDTLLGGDAAFWTASTAQKERWRKRDAATATHTTQDIWAVHDRHDVTDFPSLVPDPALDFPFELDVFQRRAIFRLERGENVFVAAHTSAGKTVVAEYAIALALRHRTKVIFTSPIKTLSNQKYRDFTERFGDVGLITGDVSLNPEAPVLIMTTEILRSMLYRGADLIRDLEFVIFDEVHWASDPERGVVWEESIILLPEACGIVMLSATVPNALEFANWVGRTRHRPVFVVSTSQRPVPLVHSLFVKNDIFPLFHSTDARFQNLNYKAAAEKQSAVAKNTAQRFGGGKNHAWVPLIKYLRKHNLDPAIIFCFSKRKCEEAADSLNSSDLTAGSAEKNQIHHFYQTSIARLSPADQRVPQIARCLDSLKRGIGVHHAGILPIIKEVTEVLFQRGLIRILFCTETFAVGVNAPARSVVFSAIRKWDGESSRALEPGEYTQMAGRAGRRGKDDVGTVLLYPAPADFPTEIELKQLLTGSAKRIKSQFRLTYNMILNLMRVDELRVEDVMHRSFNEAPAGRDSARWKKLLANGEKQLEQFDERAHELDRFRDLHAMLLRVRALSARIGPSLENDVKKNASSAFDIGRVVLVDRMDGGFALAAIIKASTARTAKLGLRGPGAGAASKSGGAQGKLCRVAILRDGGPVGDSSASPFLGLSSATGGAIQDSKDTHLVGGVCLELVDIGSSEVHAFSMLKITISDQGMNPLRGAPRPEALASTADQLLGIASDSSYWSSAPPLLDASDNVGIRDADVAEIWSERNGLVGAMSQILARHAASATAGGGEMAAAILQLSKELTLRQKVGQLQIANSDESLQLMPDYRQRVEVLRRLDYVEGGRVLLKGRAMCEVNCCELILVELCFENVLQTMSPASMAALLSTLVYQGAFGDSVKTLVDQLESVADDLHAGSIALQRILTGIGGVQAECGLPVSPIDFAASQANFGLAAAVHVWASGRPFVDVCNVVPDVAEGTIVRGIVRLSELLRETKNVARVIGDIGLQELADEAIDAVKRDVIFAASLYIS